jgi:hypothetical protein
MHDSTTRAGHSHAGWSPTPNAPGKDDSLSVVAKGLFWILASHADAKGDCHPSVATLVKVSGLSKRTVTRHLDALRAYGLIEWEVRPCQSGRQRYYHVWRAGDPVPTGGSCHESTNVQQRGRAIQAGGVMSPEHQGVMSPEHQEEEPLNKNQEQEPLSPSLLSKGSESSTTTQEESDVREPTARPEPMTDEWEPHPSLVTPEMSADMKTLGMSLSREVMQFRDWQIEKQRQQRDWDRTFRQWLNRHIDDNMKQRALATVTPESSGPNELGFYAWQDKGGETREERIARVREQDEHRRRFAERKAG